MDPSKLAGAPHCNEELPVGDPEEIYLFHQFMPLVRTKDDGTTLQVSIPVEVAYPKLVQWVQSHPVGDGPDPLPVLKSGTVPFIKDWKPIAVKAAPPPRDVYLTDVTQVLASERFEDRGKKYSLVGVDEVAERLRAGEPVVATLASDKHPNGESLRLIPTVSSIAMAPDRVQLESADIAHLVAAKTLLVRASAPCG